MTIRTLLPACAALAVTAAVSAAAQGAGSPTLQLTEVASRPLSDTVIITGVAAAPSGDAVLSFSGTTRLTVLGRDRGTVEVHSLRLRAPVGIALLPGDSLVEAVDTAGGVVRRVRLDTGGRVVDEQRYRLGLMPANATLAGEIWYVGGVEPSGAYRVYRLGGGGGAAADMGAVAAGRQFAAHLTVCGAAVVVTQRTYPFRATVLAGGRSAELEFVLPPGLTGDSADPGRRFWQSSPTVCLGSGYLRTLSDLRSDRRLLVMYDANGRVVRTRTLDAPIAVIGSVPGHDTVLAVRRIGSPELVWYDWRWSGANP